MRLEYERALGTNISDKTWRRVKRDWAIKDQDETTTKLFPLVGAIASLRKLNPKKRIKKIDVVVYTTISQNLPRLTCNGVQLYEALQRLNPQPSVKTLYRWGINIGVPLRKSKSVVYTPQQIQQWVQKISSQTRFKFNERQANQVKNDAQRASN